MSKIQIHKGESLKNNKKYFWVTYHGKNGEALATSEMLTTKANCIKNIKAMSGVFSMDSTQPIHVLDCTGKKEKEIDMKTDKQGNY